VTYALVILGSGALAGGLAVIVAALAEQSMPWHADTAAREARFRGGFWLGLLIVWPPLLWLGWPA